MRASARSLSVSPTPRVRAGATRLINSSLRLSGWFRGSPASAAVACDSVSRYPGAGLPTAGLRAAALMESRAGRSPGGANRSDGKERNAPPAAPASPAGGVATRRTTRGSPRRTLVEAIGGTGTAASGTATVAGTGSMLTGGASSNTTYSRTSSVCGPQLTVRRMRTAGSCTSARVRMTISPPPADRVIAKRTFASKGTCWFLEAASSWPRMHCGDSTSSAFAVYGNTASNALPIGERTLRSPKERADAPAHRPSASKPASDLGFTKSKIWR